MFHPPPARVLIALVISLPGMAGTVEAGNIILESRLLQIAIDDVTWDVTRIVNKGSMETVYVQAQGFSAELGIGDKIGSIGVLTPRRCEAVRNERLPQGVVFHFNYVEVRGALKYELAPEDHFAVKTLELSYAFLMIDR